jgi:UDPglucose--hexose-1-phosphate uridylyltransferase
VSEFRQDPVTGIWTLLAPERAGRPRDLLRAPDESVDDGSCPFCAGREAMTPPTRWERSVPGEEADWTVRVVENRWPALTAPDDVDGSDDTGAPPPYRSTSGFGAHEVFIETPRHGEGLADLTPEHARLLVDAWSDRIRHWFADGRLACPVIFRNWGRAAGASIAHAHTQLVVLPRVPDAIVRELGNFSGASASTGGCLLCDTIAADDAGGRAVFDDGMTVAHVPFAAPVPHAIRIAPRRCEPTIASMGPQAADSLAAALIACARALRGAFGDVAFNLTVHVAPYTAMRVAGLPFHWHVDIHPRATDFAGLEVGSGLHVNVVDPDTAAAELRNGLASW